MPIFILVILEGCLRIAGYGTDYTLFKKVNTGKSPAYLEMNKRIAGKYFKEAGLKADSQSDLFLEEKTDSTYRIVVQGASTVVGFPFYRGGSFPRILKHRLSQTFPQKNIEVINTGITAVNSYTLNDLTDQIIEQKPDLIIIYAGHNEYYGALGVGSSISYGSHPLVIRSYLFLKDFRFFQLFENTYQKLVSTTNQKTSERNTTLMEVMAKEQRITKDSDLYDQGLLQFQNNMNRLLKTYENHNIPVLFSTLVSNIKDIEPFISDSISDETAYLSRIENADQSAIKLAQKNAKAAYLMGRYYLEKNKDSAKKYFVLAKELDYLRFRAPEQINTLIEELAKEHNSTLVDMNQVFEAHASQQLIGDELMTEHVHPNVKGQFLMADAFYSKMKEQNLISDWNNAIPYSEAISDIPISRIDSLNGKLVVDELKNSWPYDLNMSGKRPPSRYFQDYSYDNQMADELHKKIRDWDQVMALAYKAYEADGDYEKALHVAQSLIFEYPEQAKVYQMAGNAALKMNDLTKALYYFKKFDAIENSSASARDLASVYKKLENADHEDALPQSND
ncbi:SGNH/GDSL hydrolase family protein [Leeuwenhoekiella sp.]|nr:SGNH/GDSL hydrolase family protein [Leeuwenhoekiella sp.]